MANALELRQFDVRTPPLSSLTFYLFIPAMNALLFGWMRAGRTAYWPRDLSVLYWLGNIFIYWLLGDLLARALARLQGRRQMPLWLLLLLSNLLVGFIASPLVAAYVGALLPLLPPDMHVTAPPPFELASWIVGTIPGASIWIGVNLLLFHGFGMPRYGYTPQGSSRTPAPPVALEAPAAPTDAAVSGMPREADLAFMEKVRLPRRGPLLAFKAEGHYLRVFTTQGEDLVLYQFSRALQEVAALAGGQVHRSWWVARDAIRGPVGPEKIVLSNGVEVPVSRSYRVVARRDGLLRPLQELGRDDRTAAEQRQRS